LAGSAFAQTSEWVRPVKGPLAEYAQRLLASDPHIDAARARWQAELHKVTLAKGLPDPAVNFGYFIETIETAVGPQQYKLGLKQVVPWPGKLLLGGQIQSQKAAAAYFAYQAEVQGRLLALHRLYFEAYLLERRIALTQQHLQLLRQWEAVMLTRYRSARARHMQLMKVQIESLKLQEDLATLKARRRPMRTAFGALLNAPQLVTMHFPDSLHWPPEAPDTASLKRRIKKNSPVLARMGAVEAAAMASIKRAQLNYLPDLGVGIDRIFTGEKYTAAGDPVPESGKDPWMLSVSLSFPLWFGKQKAGVDAARAVAVAAERDAKQRENALIVELEQLLFQQADTRRKRKWYGEVLIPKGREALSASEAAYASGEADFMNIIDAQRRLLQFSLAYEEAAVRGLQTQAALEALTGTLVSRVAK